MSNNLADYYRQLAATCVLIAADLEEPGRRAALLEMAQRWRDLADDIERSEVKPLDRDAPPKK
jgi:hypothetical protein